jgi:hypothetical protein
MSERPSLNSDNLRMQFSRRKRDEVDRENEALGYEPLFSTCFNSYSQQTPPIQMNSKEFYEKYGHRLAFSQPIN